MFYCIVFFLYKVSVCRYDIIHQTKFKYESKSQLVQQNIKYSLILKIIIL